MIIIYGLFLVRIVIISSRSYHRCFSQTKYCKMDIFSIVMTDLLHYVLYYSLISHNSGMLIPTSEMQRRSIMGHPDLIYHAVWRDAWIALDR